MMQRTGGTSGPINPPDDARRQGEHERLDQLFRRAFERRLKRSPMLQTRLGKRLHAEDFGKWDDLSEPAQYQLRDDAKDDLEALRAIDTALLSADDQLNYRLFRYAKDQEIRLFEFRDHDYPVNQMEGWHSDLPDFLITSHQIRSPADAEAYIARLEGIRALMTQVIEGLQRRRHKGIVAPKFAYAGAIASCRKVLTGRPFTDGEDSALLADFKRKVAGFGDATRSALLERAVAALREDVLPAYRGLIVCLAELDAVATRSEGVWSLPDGERYYRAKLLQHLTDSSLTPERIHEIGLSEVERIRGEMTELVRHEMRHTGSLQTFFASLANTQDPRLYYVNDDAGRNQYLAEVDSKFDQMKQAMSAFFFTLPKLRLEVRRVPSFREDGAPQGTYEDPPEDGSRPGIYWVNLQDMAEMPKFELEALAFHEGIPGHHLQRSVAVEGNDMPGFRKLARYNIVSEGWCLYAERLAREMGFYRDAYADFGRLSFELWRATRLVVDTGVHAKRWSRQQAVDYLVQTTPKTERAATAAIERYMVDPAQATSYTLGMRHLLDLRRRGEDKLAGRFDIRQFHDVVLRCGRVPAAVLQERVEDWIGQGGVETQTA